MGSGYRNDKDRFLAVFKINLLVFILEIIAGWYSGSLSMLSDGFHVSLHVVVALVALASEYEFLGFTSDRIKGVSAGINIALFFPLAGLITLEAMRRLYDPPSLELGGIFFIVAIVGLIGNIWTIKILPESSHNHSNTPPNQNKSLLKIHMFFDALGSVILILSGLFIVGTDWYLLDPIASFILAILIVIGAVFMAKKWIHNHKDTN